MPVDGARVVSGIKPSGSSVKAKVAKPPFAQPFDIICTDSLGAKGRQGRRWDSPSSLLYCLITLKTRSCRSRKRAQCQPPQQPRRQGKGLEKSLVICSSAPKSLARGARKLKRKKQFVVTRWEN